MTEAEILGLNDRVDGAGAARERRASSFGLVGDIGGTNARFALAEISADGTIALGGYRNLLCRDYASVTDAIAAYLKDLGVAEAPGACVTAVAGPVTNGAIHMTNFVWRFSEADLRAVGFRAARIINDYQALAMGAADCGEAGLRHVGGPAAGMAEQTVAVLGAGTGFGVSALARDPFGQAVMATEGGHVAFAPVDALEIEILKRLMELYGRVSVERILSGPGLACLHTVMAEIHGETATELAPEAIAQGAAAGDEACARTVEQFCAVFGSVAGDLALALGARGGVYLGGGIAPGVADQLAASRFRERFEAKGRFQPYLAAIPTWIITHKQAALIGAAKALSDL
ncbi:glucokinase [Phenylobacterium deserti]|uniref:glucokinase n=1 Tax=Phenylobacterium deserti TaxID=1914756 RepID=UPI001F0C5D0E|nr:glucokinase [Phenylobacterium deserti]